MIYREEEEQADFIYMKDPTKPIMKLYKKTSEEDEEDEEEDEL